MAPPRLVPDIGIADTVGLAAGHDTGSFGGVVPFNPYAAMPSMHVGWSLLVGIFGFRALRGNALRWVFALHPVLMAVTVSATGNHYFLDSAAGVAVVLSALLAIRLFNRKER
jgi:PAP2 superfamily